MSLREVDSHIIDHGKSGVRKVAKLAAASVHDMDELKGFRNEFESLLMNYDVLGPEAAEECIKEGFDAYKSDPNRTLLSFEEEELINQDDEGLSADQLKRKYELLQPGDQWAKHPFHLFEDWQNEAYTGDTMLGYWDWVSVRANEG